MLVFQCLFERGGNYPLTTILCYAILYTVADRIPYGGDMNTQKYMLQKDFKVWMCATLGLIKDGKMGVSIARADRIKLALNYTGKGR